MAAARQTIEAALAVDRALPAGAMSETVLHLNAHGPAVPSRPVYFVLRRVVDILVSGISLLLLLPLMVAVAVAIKIDSPGPFLFSQQRVGRDGKLFTIYKFRSMVSVAPAYTLKVSSDDPRVTRVGYFLRLSALDELPQLLNVLRGDMTLIGPRPELQFIVDMYEPWQRQRHLVTPGMTGWWQVHHRNEVPMHYGVDYDIYYVEHLGPRLDALIMLRTLRVVVTGAWRGLLPRVSR